MPDSQEPIKETVNAVTPSVKETYIKALKASKKFSLTNYRPIDDTCHFERYNFLHALGKLGIVYDTKAEILAFTAKQSVLTEALIAVGLHKHDAECAADVQSAEEKRMLAANCQKKNVGKKIKSEVGKLKSGETIEKTAVAAVKKSEKIGESLENKSKQAKNTAKPGEQAKGTPKSGGKATKSASKIVAPVVDSGKPADKKASVAASEKVSAKNAQTVREAPEYKNGFSVKNCPTARLDAFLTAIRALKGVTVTVDSSQKDVVVYTVNHKAHREKCLLRYIPQKQTAQLQGKRSNLFSEVQVILISGSDFNEAIGSHKELTGEQKRTDALVRHLKKLLPDAFDLLSEQSRIDLGIGMVDIGNDDVRLSDYSVLLVPPYRGLERFIFDLQQAYDISVKMIGQAYEKDNDGNHRLKQCYRKKTGVVYTEVMNALYNEYFERRNFYAHSDNSALGNSRMISDKNTAKEIFYRLCEIINYNGKKLKEIGFEPKNTKNRVD